MITKPGARDEDEEQQQKMKEYEEIRRVLIAERDKSVMANKLAIDFLSIFPNEIIDKIISQLSLKRKMICLTVSQSWRTNILECQSTWKHLYFHENSMAIDTWLLDITPLIGGFVKQLTLGNTHEHILLKCFEQITQGHFGKIQQLQMTGTTFITTFNT